MTTFQIPSAYIAGHQRARRRDAALADAYVRHTVVGDPLGEEVAADLFELRPAEVNALLTKVMRDRSHWASGPASLRRLMEESSEVPAWYDEGRAAAASNAFLRNSDLVLAALVAGSIVEGFGTLISKSFRIRGRVLDMGVRRLKQNGLHLVEQFLPGGNLPFGDGWRLSLRIRLIHARARLLLKRSEEWDEERLGVPISAANLFLAGASFSGRLMQHVATLGGDFSRDERDAYVHVWRYSALQMGIPEELTFHDEASAVHVFEIARMCDPPPGIDAIIMANAIINSAPLVIGITKPAERQKLAAFAYGISRGLIGDTLSDSFKFPKGRRLQVPIFRYKNRLQRMVFGMLPRARRKRDLVRFEKLMDFCNLGRLEHSYALPTAVHDEDSAEW